MIPGRLSRWFGKGVLSLSLWSGLPPFFVESFPPIYGGGHCIFLSLGRVAFPTEGEQDLFSRHWRGSTGTGGLGVGAGDDDSVFLRFWSGLPRSSGGQYLLSERSPGHDLPGLWGWGLYLWMKGSAGILRYCYLGPQMCSHFGCWTSVVPVSSYLIGGGGRWSAYPTLLFSSSFKTLKSGDIFFFPPYADAPTASAILFTFENKTVSYASFLMTWLVL